MTLSTHVYLLTEADPRDVFFECRRLLGATDAHPWVDDREGTRGAGAAILRNQAGVGLPALLSMHYRPGAMLRPSHEEHDPDICDDDCDGSWHDPAHWIDVDFDTAYSYMDEQGRGCGVLHASLVAQLGQWLDERGIRWAWRNEFTGEIHIGDRYERLFDLFKDGDNAKRWFEEIVKPAIESGFGR